MNNKVKFSIFSLIITAAVIILSVAGIVSVRHNTEEVVIGSLIVGAVVIAGLYYCPVSVEANRSEIKLHRFLAKPKVFAYKDIAAVDTCYPSAGGIRLCGSGGCFGYWGYFSDIMIGTYFGYYGSRSSCFLVRLNNGRQYVLGCENPVAMVDYIKTYIAR